MIRLLVLADEGRAICHYGSRLKGETFDNLPEQLARGLEKAYPTIFKLLDDSAPPEEKEEEQS